MNEIPPPFEPGKLPPSYPSQQDYKKIPPGKGLCGFFGFLLFVISVVFSFLIPFFFVVGLAAAISSLFFEGYRYIFVGYLLTLLIGVGLCLLILIVVCGGGNNSFR